VSIKQNITHDTGRRPVPTCDIQVAGVRASRREHRLSVRNHDSSPRLTPPCRTISAVSQSSRRKRARRQRAVEQCADRLSMKEARLARHRPFKGADEGGTQLGIRNARQVAGADFLQFRPVLDRR
jgi:tRNA U34 5-carboxymethylaminomethyl modifying enzyme MnmG/GidA